MSTEVNFEEKSVEEIIAFVASQASESDKKQAETIVNYAKAGEVKLDLLEITPPVAAILLQDCNKYNRELRLGRAKEYCRQMIAGEWRLQGQGLQFFLDSTLGDGQHRLLGLVLAASKSLTLKVSFSFYFGLEKEAVDVIDLVVKRTAADAATLEGIKHAKDKESMFKTANSYLKKIKLGSNAQSVHEIKEALIEEDGILSEALEIALRSEANIVQPSVKRQVSSAIAYALLKCGWETVEIEKYLRELQQGFSSVGDQAPIYVATDYIINKQTDNGTRWLIIMKAFVLAKKGATSVKPREFAEIKKKPVPNPKTLTV